MKYAITFRWQEYAGGGQGTGITYKEVTNCKIMDLSDDQLDNEYIEGILREDYYKANMICILPLPVSYPVPLEDIKSSL